MKYVTEFFSLFTRSSQKPNNIVEAYTLSFEFRQYNYLSDKVCSSCTWQVVLIGVAKERSVSLCKIIMEKKEKKKRKRKGFCKIKEKEDKNLLF